MTKGVKGKHRADVFGNRSILGISELGQREHQFLRYAQLQFFGAFFRHGFYPKKAPEPEGPEGKSPTKTAGRRETLVTRPLAS